MSDDSEASLLYPCVGVEREGGGREDGGRMEGGVVSHRRCGSCKHVFYPVPNPDPSAKPNDHDQH